MKDGTLKQPETCNFHGQHAAWALLTMAMQQHQLSVSHCHHNSGKKWLVLSCKTG